MNAIKTFQPSYAIEIVAPQYGTGYRIGGRLVLTCRHLFDEYDNTCKVRFRKEFDYLDKKDIPAKIIWKAPGNIDIALIELPENIEGCDPITFGNLPDRNSAEIVKFDCLGFPEFLRYTESGIKYATGLPIQGTINVATRVPYGRLLLNIQENKAIQPTDKQLAQLAQDQSPWQGTSGAAIVCNGLVVGVQSKHPITDRPQSLEAESLARVYDHEDWCTLLRQHNISTEPLTVRGNTGNYPIARPEIEQTLIRQVKAEISNHRSQCLHNNIFINLGKEEVQTSWETTDNKILNPGVSIQDVFDLPETARRLLVLGKPGSGKTTTMLELARELLEKSYDPNESIPLLLNLSSWTPEQQSISDWIAEELNIKYGVRSDIGKKWLQKQKLSLLLDGLDEVRSEYQDNCVCALNKWIGGQEYSSPGQLVVCCRSDTYDRLAKKLTLHKAINLMGLNYEQLTSYLKSINQLDIWSLVEGRPALYKLIQKPLFLRIITTNGGIISREPKTLRLLSQANSLEYLMIEMYVLQMLEQNSKHKSRKVITRTRLIRLAKLLHNSKEFSVEQIQPSWLPKSKLKELYSFRVRLFSSLSCCVPLSLLGGTSSYYFSNNLRYSTSISLLLITFGTCLGTLSINKNLYVIFPPQQSWSYDKLGRSILIGLAGGITAGGAISTFLIVGWLIYLTINDFSLKDFFPHFIISTLGFWSLIGGVIGCGIGVLRSFSPIPEVTVRRYVKKVVFSFFTAAAQQMLIIFCLAYLLSILILILNTLAFYLWNHGFENIFETTKYIFNEIWSYRFENLLCFPLILGSVFSLTWGLLGNFGQFIKYFVLRWILHESGYLPWDAEVFLEYCKSCKLLSGSQGRYKFIHPAVRQYFLDNEYLLYIEDDVQ